MGSGPSETKKLVNVHIFEEPHTHIIFEGVSLPAALCAVLPLLLVVHTQ